MSMCDPMADMLTRMRNATKARSLVVDMPSSQLKINVAEVLKREGYISGYCIKNEKPREMLSIDLKYGPNKQQVITGISRISKPGCRQYRRSDQIPRVMSGLGIAILTTSKGVLSDREARNQKVGGEILCAVW